MKRITFLILSCMISCMTFAQTWSCPEFDSDLAKYNEVAKKYKSSGNKMVADVVGGISCDKRKHNKISVRDKV